MQPKNATSIALPVARESKPYAILQDCQLWIVDPGRPKQRIKIFVPYFNVLKKVTGVYKCQTTRPLDNSPETTRTRSSDSVVDKRTKNNLFGSGQKNKE